MKTNVTQRMRIWILIALIFAISGVATLVKPAAAATSIVVTITGDENGGGAGCALREAIIAANTAKAFGGCPQGVGAGTPLSGPFDIYLPAGTYQLTITGALDDFSSPNPNAGDLDILTAMTIRGDGPNDSLIEAKNQNRVLHVHGVNGTRAVNILNLGITGGYKGASFDPNNPVGGGGLLVYDSTVNLRFVKIYENMIDGGGGGIGVKYGSFVSIDRSEISGNTAQTASAINNEATLTVDRSSIHENFNTGTGANGAVVASSLLSNTTTRIVNSTIAKNLAPPNAAAGVTVSSTGNLELLNNTIVDNQGFGLEVLPSGSGWVKNTIIARAPGGISNCSMAVGGSFVSQGHNAFGGNSCDALKVASDKNVSPAEETNYLAANPELNDGLTPNYALIEDANNSFLDAGDNSGCPTLDQRFRGRPAIGKPGGVTPICDIGSFELFGSPLTEFMMLPLVSR